MAIERRFLRLLLATSVLAVTLVGCLESYTPSPERVACLQACGREKDTCILNARGAAQIQRCDAQSRSCGAGCSS